MPNTPYRGYYYPLFSSAAKVPDDLRRALEAVDADVEGLFQDLRIPISGAIDHGDGTYSFVLSDGTVLEPIAQPIPPSNELTIGTVETADVGVPAEATIEGEPPNQVLSLVLPRGSAPKVTWDGTVIIVDGTRGPDLKSTTPGPTGKTAYQYAVEAGFTGTEAEFAEAQLPDTITWENIEGKPDAYPPETHTHSIAEVQDLSSRLAGLQDALDALKAGPWVDLPLTSPWVPYSTTSSSYYPGVRARRTAAGVQIQGMVKGGGENTEICTLPAHLNPEFGGHFASISNSQPATVFISPTGQLRYLSGGSPTSYVSINLVVPLP